MSTTRVEDPKSSSNEQSGNSRDNGKKNGTLDNVDVGVVAEGITGGASQEPTRTKQSEGVDSASEVTEKARADDDDDDVEKHALTAPSYERTGTKAKTDEIVVDKQASIAPSDKVSETSVKNVESEREDERPSSDASISKGTDYPPMKTGRDTPLTQPTAGRNGKTMEASPPPKPSVPAVTPSTTNTASTISPETSASAIPSPPTKTLKSIKSLLPPGVTTIDVPHEHDVLFGRGAATNSHSGNQYFRALCFERKEQFDANSHAFKRRIATEIVELVKALVPPGRFLKRKDEVVSRAAAAAGGGGGGALDSADHRGGDNPSNISNIRKLGGPWIELSTERAIQKAFQVIRDFRRPDRIAMKEMAKAKSGKRKRRRGDDRPNTADTSSQEKKQKKKSGDDADSIIVQDHDVLSGRGAFVNAHPGNKYLRKLAIARKKAFDSGMNSDKRSLASEIVQIIKGLKPPGRFLERALSTTPTKNPDNTWNLPPRGLEGPWKELSDEKAIRKAWQVMRDLRRPDRMFESLALSQEPPH